MNLELVNTIDLVEELSKRFDTCVIIGLKAPLAANRDEASPMLWKYRGGALQAIGLCQMAGIFIASDIGHTHLTQEDL